MGTEKSTCPPATSVPHQIPQYQWFMEPLAGDTAPSHFAQGTWPLLFHAGLGMFRTNTESYIAFEGP